MTSRRSLLLAAAVAAAGSGLIHIAVAPEHFDEWWGFGTFFVVCAEAQLAWALLLALRPGRRTLVVGLAGSLLLVALWAVSRTSGLPFGPEPWHAESVGALDLASVAFELVIAAACALALNRSAAPDESLALTTAKQEASTPMHRPRILAVALTALALTALPVAGAFAASSSEGSHSMHATSKALTAADLRVALVSLFTEHASLAMNATDAGVSGSKAFPAIAKQLDKNSVAISQAIASVYGAKAGKVFLDGKFMWRDHIKFFVDYTLAVAKKDTAAQAKAVANLKSYTMTFGSFLAGATGLPKLAVQNDLLGHVLELKNQLDAYAAGNYALSQSIYHDAFQHMVMTGDLVAGAIAKQKHLS